MKGEYVAFVDSDDYVLPEMYEKMLNCLIENNVDFCVCQWQYEYADGKQVIQNKRIHPDIYGEHYSVEFAHFLYCGSYENVVVVSMCNKLYRKSVINSIRFDGHCAEDEEFNDKINGQQLKTYVMADQFYIYVQNSMSITNMPFSEEKLHFLNVLSRRQKLFFDDIYLRQETEKLYCNIYVEYYYKAKALGIPVKNKVYYEIFKRMFLGLCSENACDSKFFVRMCIFFISPVLYKFLTTH